MQWSRTLCQTSWQGRRLQRAAGIPTFDHEDSSLGSLQLNLSIYYSIKLMFAIFNLCWFCSPFTEGRAVFLEYSSRHFIFFKLAFWNWNSFDSGGWVDSVLFWYLVNFENCNLWTYFQWLVFQGPISEIVFRDIQALICMHSGQLWALIWSTTLSTHLIWC